MLFVKRCCSVSNNIEISKDNNNETNPESRISKLIMGIRLSDDHDNVGSDLYYELCNGSGNPPYHKWVATWILKCIREKFQTSTKADILLASFALFPGYSLKNTTIQDRLQKYLHENESRYSKRLKKLLDNDTSDLYATEKDIINALIRMENLCVNELIEYILTIPSLPKHTEDLGEYGNLTVLSDGKIIYKPKLEKLGCLEQTAPESQKTTLSSTNNEIGHIIAPPKVIKSKFIVKTGNDKKKFKAKFKECGDSLDVYITGPISEENRDYIKKAIKRALAEIAICVLAFMVLSYTLNSLLDKDDNSANTYVKKEPQQSSVPDVTKSSDGGIKYDNRENNGELETSF